MNVHLTAIHDTAIRLNSTARHPAMMGKSMDGTQHQRAFVKAVDAALESGLDMDAVASQVSASLGGGVDAAREFLKANVKAHTRVVNGRLVQVKEHQDNRGTGQRHWDKPHIKAAEELSAKAHEATARANKLGTKEAHQEALEHHQKAATAHAQNVKRATSKVEREEAEAAVEHHGRWSDVHATRSESAGSGESKS